MALPPCAHTNQLDYLDNMADKAFRLLRMLELIPRDPHRILTADLAQKLCERWRGLYFGQHTPRTLQRDLLALSTVCPGLEWEEQGKAYAWYWGKGSKTFSLPRMDAAEAVALDTARKFLVPILPVSVRERLDPYFGIADEVLKQAELGRRGPRWRDKVRVVPPTQPIVAPAVNPLVFKVVLSALFDNRQLKFDYRNAQGITKTHTSANPLALVHWGEIAYLLATQGVDDRVFQYALHRIGTADPLPEHPARRPKDFDVDRWIEQGHLGIRRGGEIQLKALFRGPRSRRFAEAPLSGDQKTEVKGDWLHVSATVNDTEELRWWLLGFGPDVEVLAPAALRQEIQDKVRAMTKLYRRTGKRDTAP